MKNKFLLLLTLSVFWNVLYAQDYWMQLDPPDSVTIYKIDIAPTGNVLLGTNTGIYISQDEGITWGKLGNLNAGVSNIEYYSDGEISAGDAQLFNSTDNGASWHLVHNSLLMKALHCTNEDYLLLGKWGGILKSMDRGYTWDTVYPTGSATIFGSFLEYNGYYYSGASEFIGGENNGFFISQDYGNTWELFSLQGYGITALALDIDHNFLAGTAISPLGQQNGLFISMDAGFSWTQIFDQQQVTEVAVDSSGGYYIGLESWAGGNWGVYYSPDCGSSWQELNSGIPIANSVYDLDISSKHAYCIILNYKNERVLYRSKNPIVSTNEHIADLQEGLILFPNPLRGSKKLTICNVSPTDYQTSIFDSNGNSISESIIISKHSTTVIDKTDKWLPGVYFVVFRNKNSCFSKIFLKTNN